MLDVGADLDDLVRRPGQFPRLTFRNPLHCQLNDSIPTHSEKTNRILSCCSNGRQSTWQGKGKGGQAYVRFRLFNFELGRGYPRPYCQGHCPVVRRLKLAGLMGRTRTKTHKSVLYDTTVEAAHVSASRSCRCARKSEVLKVQSI
jgi:hypothetical protein